MLLWTRWVIFRRTCPNCFAKHPKVFSQRPENMKRITTFFLRKHHLASKCCYRNAECCFDNTGKVFPGSSPRVFSSTFEITKKFLLLMKKKFVPKCSCEVMKSSFKQHFRKFSARKNATNQKPLFFVPEKLPKMYLWTRRIKFWQQC